MEEHACSIQGLPMHAAVLPVVGLGLHCLGGHRFVTGMQSEGVLFEVESSDIAV